MDAPITAAVNPRASQPISRISHIEIRKPAPCSGKRPSRSSVLFTGAKRLRGTRRALDFSKSEPGQAARVESSADLGEVVSDTVKLVDRQTRFRDIDLALSVDEGLPRVRGDHERLRQLLLNLLFNAADALEGKGTIEVRARNGGDVVQLTVEDDGPGIDETILDQVFDPFVTTKGAGQGTGLGLAVCHTIVERLGGSIEAGNRKEGGAAFEVTLPTAT